VNKDMGVVGPDGKKEAWKVKGWTEWQDIKYILIFLMDFVTDTIAEIRNMKPRKVLTF
jgi:hypothetical protein